MHIAEGVLSAPVLAAGAALALAGTAVGFRRLEGERLVRVGLLASGFFVASLVHVPIGPVSGHLILNGLVGLLLGWAAFPAILTALLLQALLFQYGGFTTLGVNCFTMALPAVLCGLAFRRLVASGGRGLNVAAFCAGSLSVLGAALLTALALALTDQGFTAAAKALVLAHLPVMAIEGFVTAAVAGYLAKVKPEALAPTPL